MATSAANQLYPFSSEKGTPIPLDIIRPLGAMKLSIAAGAAFAWAIPADYSLVSIFSSIDVVIDFTNLLTYPVASAADLDSALIIPANAVVTVALPSVTPAKIIPCNADEAGSVYVTCIQKWAAIGLQRQLTNG